MQDNSNSPNYEAQASTTEVHLPRTARVNGLRLALGSMSLQELERIDELAHDRLASALEDIATVRRYLGRALLRDDRNGNA